jgi:hypothetical protein
VVSSLHPRRGENVLIQISAPVTPGGSGGPLINDAGLIIGVVVANPVTGRPGNQPEHITIPPILQFQQGLPQGFWNKTVSVSRSVREHRTLAIAKSAGSHPGLRF